MVELRYPIIEDTESFFRILNEGKFKFYYATIPESIESEKEWIKRREIHMNPQNKANEKVAIKNNFEKEGLLKRL